MQPAVTFFELIYLNTEPPAEVIVSEHGLKNLLCIVHKFKIEDGQIMRELVTYQPIACYCTYISSQAIIGFLLSRLRHSGSAVRLFAVTRIYLTCSGFWLEFCALNSFMERL